MADTLHSFFDTNKIYIKSVQQEATMRAKRNVSTEDPLYQEYSDPITNRQEFT